MTTRMRDIRASGLPHCSLDENSGDTLNAAGASADCTTCCTDCRRSVARNLSNTTHPLWKLIPAGTIVISMPSAPECGHTHDEDGWHSLSGLAPLSPYGLPAAADEDIVRAVENLVDERYLKATFNFRTGMLYIRIYITPLDFMSVSATRRNEVQRRDSLRSVLTKIVSNETSWNGLPTTEPLKELIPCDLVSLRS
jgi:hypothetical protein